MSLILWRRGRGTNTAFEGSRERIGLFRVSNISHGHDALFYKDVQGNGESGPIKYFLCITYEGFPLTKVFTKDSAAGFCRYEGIPKEGVFLSRSISSKDYVLVTSNTSILYVTPQREGLRRELR